MAEQFFDVAWDEKDETAQTTTAEWQLLEHQVVELRKELKWNRRFLVFIGGVVFWTAWATLAQSFEIFDWWDDPDGIFPEEIQHEITTVLIPLLGTWWPCSGLPFAHGGTSEMTEQTLQLQLAAAAVLPFVVQLLKALIPSLEGRALFWANLSLNALVAIMAAYGIGADPASAVAMLGIGAGGALAGSKGADIAKAKTVVVSERHK